MVGRHDVERSSRWLIEAEVEEVSKRQSRKHKIAQRSKSRPIGFDIQVV